MDILVTALIVLAAVGCGVVGGVFFAFSGFVMKSLARLPPASGIAAMQSINVVALTPPLMIALFGTAIVCLALAITAIIQWGDGGAWLAFVGSLLYLVGAVLVTIASNVPRNNQLAAADPESNEGHAVWAEYASVWTTRNTVRAVAAISAAAALTFALATR